MKPLTHFTLTLLALLAFPFITFTQAAIELQPHQKVPGQYLRQHPDQKGLLLFHSLGSGKTYVSLDYAEKSPYKKVILLLPEFLKGNWITQMKSFGIQDSKRYEMISLNEPERLLNRDLSQTLVIVDEVHKLIQKIRLSDSETSEKMIQIYQKLKTANKLLLLTGTPIFVSTSDIAYIANLLEQDKDYPIDPIKFKTEYMKVKPVTSLVRGNFTESKIMMLAVPFLVTLGAVATLATTAPYIIPFIAMGGSAVIPLTNEIFPVNQVAFREFDAEKWKDFSSRYVSYYEVKLAESENYPTKNIIPSQFEYTDQQTDFFLSFVDEDLDLKQLKTLLSEKNLSYSDSYLKIHSSRLQKQLLANSTSGREIGNLEMTGDTGELIESRKFLKILDLIKTKPGQVVIYSNYFSNGIKKFAAFLERQGMQNDFVILSPDQATEKQISIIDQYNKLQKRILLVHPEITEGISLTGTEQLHILEPIENPTLLEQIVGRAIRYQSHLNLPKNRQVVNVYLWEASVNYGALGVPTSAGLLKREHWQKKYSEVNPSSWTKGITDLDANYFLKDETPDQRVNRRSSEIKKDLSSFRNLLEEFSIEQASR